MRLRPLAHLVSILAACVFAGAAGAAPQTFTVTNTNDSGTGSLRQAILDANANVGRDTIRFRIPDAGVKTIAPATPLPSASEAVVIDGTTQPTYAGKPRIAIRGNGQVGSGLRLDAGPSLVKGLAIDGWSRAIYLAGDASRVEGNYLGTAPNGMSAPQGNGAGVVVASGSGHTIGGTSARARNVISGNIFYGVSPWDGSDLRIVGNFIGTDAAGTRALPNGTGIYSDSLPLNVHVGGTAAGERNVISGNSGIGLRFRRPTGALVQGNLIGVGADGRPLGNGGIGLHIDLLAPMGSGIVVGGTSVRAANTIAYNVGVGIAVYSSDGSGVARIRRNSVHSNGSIGIDLRDGSEPLGGPTPLGNPTPNDPDDADTGPNGFQNSPEITAVRSVRGGARIFALLDTAPSSAYVIDFFGSRRCDPSGYGEGQTYLGSKTVLTNPAGIARFSHVVSRRRPGFVSATATAPSGATSEFSLCAPRRPFVVTGEGDGPDAGAGAGAFDGICRPAVGSCTLRAALAEAEARAGKDSILFRIPGAGVKTLSPASPLPALDHPVVLDGTSQPSYRGKPRIELNGTFAGPSASGLSVVETNGSAVRGLAVNRFGGHGIVVVSSRTNRIERNFVGTNAAGTADRGNGGNGIHVLGSSSNVVLGNVVSGNGGFGVQISGGSIYANPTGNLVRGNRIGTNAAGSGAIPNVAGGVLLATSTGAGNAVGGPNPAHANRIAFNGGAGIALVGGAGNPLLGNLLRANGGLGIDLALDGVTANDPGDADAGPNDLQNFPVLTRAVNGGGRTTVRGRLDSTPGRRFRIELFASPGCDPSGNGEGAARIASFLVRTNAAGSASFSREVGGVPLGRRVTATATSGGGSTSELSACRRVVRR